MSDLPQHPGLPPTPPPAAPVVIDNDLPCVGCGYNLRTLPLDGRCPECGTPVRSTYDATELARSDPAWRQRVAWWLRVLSWPHLLVILMFGVGWGVRLTHPWVSPTTYGWLTTGQWALQCCITLLAVVAVVWIVRPEPGRPRLMRRARRVGRITAYLTAVAAVLRVAAPFTLMLTYGSLFPVVPGTTGFWQVYGLWYTGWAVGAIAGTICQLAVLSLLWSWFNRAGRRGYRTTATWCFWTKLAAGSLEFAFMAGIIVFGVILGSTSNAMMWLHWLNTIVLLVVNVGLHIALFVVTRAAAATMLRQPAILRAREEGSQTP